MLTIKGKEWNLVKPSLPYKANVYKNEKSCQQIYDKRPKTIEEHCGRAVSICIMLLTGEVLSIANGKGTHLDVLEKYKMLPCFVKLSGWKLDNGNYVWR